MQNAIQFMINLPQLLGPAYLLIYGFVNDCLILRAAISGTAIISLFPHQEARFLLPAVPLWLSSVRLPARVSKLFVGIWLVFNVLLALLMGVYHQGGVVPTQAWLETQSDIAHVYWWKTYSPPTWLLGERTGNVTTIDLMGLKAAELQGRVCPVTAGLMSSGPEPVLVAPRSAVALDHYLTESKVNMTLTELWRYDHHLNLDDMDFGDDGVVSTLRRVIGRRGLVAWRVTCPDLSSRLVGRDW